MSIRYPLLAATALIASACDRNCLALADVTAEGDSGRVLRAAEGARSDFATWTTADVCLSKLSVSRVGGDRGRYNPTTRAVTIDPDNPSPRTSALHELCHAADLQNDLSDATMDDYVDYAAHGKGRKRKAKEGFAEVCSMGAVTMELLLGLDCPTDDVPDPIWAQTHDLVYGARPAVGRTTFAPTAHWSPPIPAENGVRLWGCEEDQSGNLMVMVQDLVTEEYIRQRLDLQTGVPLDGTSVTHTAPWEDVPGPSGWAPFAVRSDDQGAVMWAQHFLDGEHGSIRLLAEMDHEWTLVETCFQEDECLFEMGGTVYRGYEEDGSVYWGPVVR